MVVGGLLGALSGFDQSIGLVLEGGLSLLGLSFLLLDLGVQTLGLRAIGLEPSSRHLDLLLSRFVEELGSLLKQLGILMVAVVHVGELGTGTLVLGSGPAFLMELVLVDIVEAHVLGQQLVSLLFELTALGFEVVGLMAVHLFQVFHCEDPS